MYYSDTLKGFIPDQWKEDGTFDPFPEDAILMTEDEIATYWTKTPPVGKMLGVEDGHLAWVDLPPLTKEELLAQAEEKKLQLLRDVNQTINDNQWPSKLALGRMKDAEKKQFGLWLDYLDLINAVDTSKPSDIEWPKAPAQ